MEILVLLVLEDSLVPLELLVLQDSLVPPVRSELVAPLDRLVSWDYRDLLETVDL